MKPLFTLLCVGALTFLASAGEPTAKSLKKCPSGHTTLKNVPIAYGLPPWEGPAAKKWQKAVENLEFVSGGCVSSNDSPKHEVICTTCRFAHSIFLTTSPEDGSWTRSSPNLGTFPTPISDLVKSFPVPAKPQLAEPVSYTQSLSDRLEVQYEGVGYRTTASPEKVRNDIDGWLKANNIKCTFTSRTHTSTLDGAKRDMSDWKTEELSVSIIMHHEHSDKASSINATFYK